MSRSLLRRLPSLAMAMLFGSVAHAESRVIVVPVSTIYPGSVIREWMLQPGTIDDVGSDIVVTKSEAIGKQARRTLLAGRAIAQEFLEEPNAVQNGAGVQLVFVQAGVTIIAAGQALQAARVGQQIRVRNSDSGLVVVGIVAPDGSVRVGG